MKSVETAHEKTLLVKKNVNAMIINESTYKDYLNNNTSKEEMEMLELIDKRYCSPAIMEGFIIMLEGKNEY